ADHQWLVQLADAVLVEVAGGDRAGALERVGVQGVEGAAAHDPQGATLGRLGVDVIQMAEVLGVPGQAEHGVTVLTIDGRVHQPRQAGCQQQDVQEKQWADRGSCKHGLRVRYHCASTSESGRDASMSAAIPGSADQGRCSVSCWPGLSRVSTPFQARSCLTSTLNRRAML